MYRLVELMAANWLGNNGTRLAGSGKGKACADVLSLIRLLVLHHSVCVKCNPAACRVKDSMSRMLVCACIARLLPITYAVRAPGRTLHCE